MEEVTLVLQIGALVEKLETLLEKLLPLTNDTNVCPVLNTELFKINFIPKEL